MTKFLDKVSRNILDFLYLRFFVFFLLFFVIFATIVYQLTNSQSTQILVDNYLLRQEKLAQFSADSAEGYISLLSNSALTMANQVEAQGTPDDLDKLTKNFVKNWAESAVSGIVIVDVDGIAISASRVEVGTSLADREWFQWSKTAGRGQHLIGSPIEPRINDGNKNMIITLSVPYFRQEEFAGSISIGIDLTNLYHEVIKPTKDALNTIFYVLSQDGTIISSHDGLYVGESIEEVIEKNSFLGGSYYSSLAKEKIVQRKSGYLDILIPSFESPDKIEPHLVGYAPAIFNGQSWTIAVVTPREKALTETVPSYINQIGVTSVGFLILLLLAILVAKDRAYREGYLDYGREYFGLKKKNKEKFNKK